MMSALPWERLQPHKPLSEQRWAFAAEAAPTKPCAAMVATANG